MSRIGKKPILLPDGVTARLDGAMLVVAGPKGEIAVPVSPDIGVAIEEKTVVFAPVRTTKRTPALWGLARSLAANAVSGVTSGFQKKLELEGIGFRMQMEGSGALLLQLGFSHPVRVAPLEGITFQVEKNAVTVSGIRKDMVGQAAASLRALKPAEPYKGKGFRYEGEIVRRKAGKKASAGG